MEDVYVKQNAKGMTYQFTFEDIDYSAYSARINIWSNETLLVDGGSCSVSKSGSNTVVSYVVDAAATATVGTYYGEIAFYSGTSFLEPSESFKWIVEESGEALS